MILLAGRQYGIREFFFFERLKSEDLLYILVSQVKRKCMHIFLRLGASRLYFNCSLCIKVFSVLVVNLLSNESWVNAHQYDHI